MSNDRGNVFDPVTNYDPALVAAAAAAGVTVQRYIDFLGLKAAADRLAGNPENAQFQEEYRLCFCVWQGLPLVPPIPTWYTR